MQNPNVEYIDIGPLLAAAAQALPPHAGTVIHGEAFSLFEAMSAVEIGNPKMDAGVLATPRTLEQLLEEGVAPVELDVRQRLAVMDKLLEMEATWHTGGALAQTIFTCLYLLKPERISADVCLFAFCKGVTATCSLVRSLVLSGNVVEEEDFNVHAFGLPVDEQPRAPSTLGLLGAHQFPPLVPAPAAQQAAEVAACVAALDQALAWCKAGAWEQADDSAWKAVIDRLLLRKELVLGLSGVLTKGAPQIAPAARSFGEALLFLERVQARPAAQAAAPDAATDRNGDAASSGGAEACGFDDAVNRHLMAPAPPRAIKVLSWEASCALLKKSLQHMMKATDIQNVNSFETLQQWVREFARLKAGPLARSVAHYLLLHQSWGLADPAATSSAEALKKQAAAPPPPPAPEAPAPSPGPSPPPGPEFLVSLSMMSQACFLPKAAYKAIGADVDMFLEQSVIAVGNWCQAMLMNSCRQRRRLRRGLEDWGHLYHHALNAEFTEEFTAHTQEANWQWAPQEGPEGQPVQGPLATWVERETCQCMLLHLLMGFELELYEPKEFTMMFWYCDALANAQRSAVQILKEAMPLPAVAAPAAAAPAAATSSPKLPSRAGSAKPGKKKAEKKPAAAAAAASAASAAAIAAWERSQRRLQMEEVGLERTHYLCQGYMRLMLAIKKADLLKSPPLPFSSEEERFHQRFASFHHFVTVPEPLSYRDFATSTDVTNFTAPSLLKLAVEAFQLARKCLGYEAHIHAQSAPQRLEELKDLDRVAAQNIMACEVLSRALEQSPDGGPLSIAVTCDNFSRHPHFPVIGVKSVK